MRGAVVLHTKRIEGAAEPSRATAPGTAPMPMAVRDPEFLAPTGFGPHLVFDGYGCPSRRLGDVSRLYALLDSLPERIHMTKIMPPYVFKHRGPGSEDGVSGFVLIAESHISIHTFPSRQYVNVDIFSCESFDVADALSVLKHEFSPRRVEWKLIDRGSEFPKHMAHSRALVEGDRRALTRSLGLEASR